MYPSLTRRRLLGVTGGSLLGASLLGPRIGTSNHAGPDAEDGWLQPRADSRNSATTADPGPGADGTVGWDRTLETHRRYEHAGLALVDGTLLVPTHRSLRAIDVGSGAERWRYAYRQPPPLGTHDRPQLDTEPRVRDGVVYLVFQTDVCALDLDSRRLRWRYELNSSSDGLHLFGNTVSVSALVDGGDRLLALDAETGLERWRQAGRLTPLAARSGLLVGAHYDDGRLVGLEAETGARRWESDAAIGASSLSRGQVAVADDFVAVVASNGDLTALETDSGNRRWTIPDESTDRSTHHDSIALDASNGALYWSRPNAESIDRIDLEGRDVWQRERSALEFGLSVGGETVYASRADGLLALEADTGDERFRVSVDTDDSDPFGSTPLIAGDRVYHLLGETVYEVSPQ
ncbi:PQQ-binding-like beta-propeller repeat protein [Haloterrigena alkaliphila]|uniref:PQQ-binding-like beta-propeller repeat protein n=1 Tax=Haloterrigena alkaliphila TaxID=2816475 RepID=A0A8A2VE15_9EURY|nr:PQQ-binding-like beta-propeller repeat protein [Haloterrigena alkaliphila]QSW99496.1 PQQ-binding-like beta-propeller repeat protein [Haloterrigena alkaliphila]